MTSREYPPPNNTPAGFNWTKDTTDKVLAYDGTTYTKYKTTISGAPYGNGAYIAWANSIWYYLDGTTYDAQEWPASGAFDKINGDSSSRGGWHTHQNHNTVSAFSSTADASVPPNLYVSMPMAILVTSYSFQSRPGCCADQMPSKWRFYGSNDGLTWTLIHEQNNITGWSLAEVRTFTVSGNHLYHTFRWELLRSSGSLLHMHLSEVRVFGYEPTVTSVGSQIRFSDLNILLGRPSSGQLRAQDVYTAFGGRTFSSIRGQKPNQGSSEHYPAIHAQSLKTQYNYTGSGLYWIRPNLCSTVVRTLCLFDTFSGGWTCFMAGKFQHTYGLDSAANGFPYDNRSGQNIFSALNFYLGGDPVTGLTNATFGNFNIDAQYFLTRQDWYKRVPSGALPNFLYYVSNSSNGDYDAHAGNNHTYITPTANETNFLTSTTSVGNLVITTPSCKVRGVTVTAPRYWTQNTHIDLGASGISTTLVTSEDAFGHPRIHSTHFTTNQYMLRFIR